MYLKCHPRFKDGKEHRYWSIAEKRRCARTAGRSIGTCCTSARSTTASRPAGSAASRRSRKARHRQLRLALFPADRPIPAHAADFGVQVRLSEFRFERPRQWGACWVFCQIWEQLQLDRVLARLAAAESRGHGAGITCCWCLVRLPAARPGQRVATASAVVRAQRDGRPARGGPRRGGQGHAVPLPGQAAGPQGGAVRVPDAAAGRISSG